MKKLILVILWGITACHKSTPTPTYVGPTGGVTKPIYSFGANYIWNDEFDNNGKPDSKKWNYDIGGNGWGNNELQNYTDSLANASVENGLLTITAQYQKSGSRAYSSARLVTKNKGDWQYGRFVIRAKLPAGLGTWPAIWMLATKQTYGQAYWPDNGEIDIMECVGYDPGIIHASLHTKAKNFMINTQVTSQITIRDFDTEFHDYILEWTPESIKMFVDNQQYLSYYNLYQGWESWPFNEPFHLLLNIAVGGNWGGQKGVDNAVFPQKMQVDYVRVYPLVQQ